jgi:hypothetical protein
MTASAVRFVFTAPTVGVDKRGSQRKKVAPVKPKRALFLTVWMREKKEIRVAFWINLSQEMRPEGAANQGTRKAISIPIHSSQRTGSAEDSTASILTKACRVQATSPPAPLWGVSFLTFY